MFAIFLAFAFAAAASDNNTETYNLINSTSLMKSGCESRCGELIVPYPFGIKSSDHSINCSISQGFDIYCNKLSNPPKAYITEGGYSHIKLISDSTVRISNIVAGSCSTPDGTSRSYNVSAELLQPYTYSKVNKFTLIGCNSYAWLNSRSTNNRTVSTGCIVFCSSPEEVGGPDECSGNGCCQSSVPQDMFYYTTRINDVLNSNSSSSFAPCTYAFLGEENAYKFNGTYDLAATDLNDTSVVDYIESNVPVVLEWAIGTQSCAEAANGSTTDFACQSNSICVNSTRDGGGYRCQCKDGYQGNPYLAPGCQDIDECTDATRYPCYGNGKCVNTVGNYTCTCKGGYSGDGKVTNGCQRKRFNGLPLYIGLGLGVLTLMTVLSVLHLMVKKRKLIKLREEFFKQNGGLLLENKLKTIGGSLMKIFQVEELEDATDNYAEYNILGRGGNGIVYKGILPDKRIVAIKKSQKLDQEQRDQFINEMVILAQINHQNVVQLLGCCLETEVPMLAYEFVSNDTLYSHIDNRTSGKGRLSWDTRLRIAHESAAALAYLHNDARTSIIHRDVKSTNILLDDNYTAKIADFGASRFVPLGHDQVTTLVQGTIGYLDPEYFHQGKLTDKSDVYSFGVVLAELLTGKKTIDVKRGSEDVNLATYFLKAKMKNQLLEILDHQVIKEAIDEQLKSACDLVCRCLNQVGGNRPSIKDVATELETLRKSGKQHPRISEENYMEASSLMIESEEHDLYTVPLVANSASLENTVQALLE